MADSPLAVTNWLLHESGLKAKIVEFCWPARLGVALHDFRVSLGDQAVGRGSDISDVTALEKAATEAIERVVCIAGGYSTHGVASHPNPSQAMLNAKCEALENALFAWHQRARIPFWPKHPVSGLEIGDQVRRLGGNVRWMAMAHCTEFASSICVIKFRDQYFLGRAIGAVEQVDARSAIEAFRNFIAFVADPLKFAADVESDPNLWIARTDFYTENIELFAGTNKQLIHEIGAVMHAELISIDGCSFPVATARAAAVLDVG